LDKYEFLELLTNGHGVSGFEYTLSKAVIDAFTPLCDSVKIDKMGNVIAHKKGSGDGAVKIMMAAHLDEIGFMVKYIEDNGFIRFTTIGGIDPRTTIGQEVWVHGVETILGVVGSKPPHLQDAKEQEETIKLEDMIIDTGYSKEKLLELVSIGDTITVKRDTVKLLNTKAAGKAMDDRAGVAALLETLKILQGMNHYPDVYMVATVQEEVSMTGAFTSTYHIQPDIGIAVDVGFGTTPELEKADTIELGKGPGITIGGNVHPTLVKRLFETGKVHGIPCQKDVAPGPTGTDARAMQITKEGIPALVVSIPLRYMHTSVELLDLEDIHHTARLLAQFTNSVKEGELEGLLCF
jgi:endoglucanase